MSCTRENHSEWAEGRYADQYTYEEHTHLYETSDTRDGKRQESDHTGNSGCNCIGSETSILKKSDVVRYSPAWPWSTRQRDRDKRASYGDAWVASAVASTAAVVLVAAVAMTIIAGRRRVLNWGWFRTKTLLRGYGRGSLAPRDYGYG